MNDDQKFIAALAELSMKKENFEKINEIFLLKDEDMINYWKETKGVSDECINKLANQAKEGRLKIYFENILCFF